MVLVVVCRRCCLLSCYFLAFAACCLFVLACAICWLCLVVVGRVFVRGLLCVVVDCWCRCALLLGGDMLCLLCSAVCCL